MHVEQRILRQRNTPQGNFTILPTELADLPTEQAQGGVTPNKTKGGRYLNYEHNQMNFAFL